MYDTRPKSTSNDDLPLGCDVEVCTKNKASADKPAHHSGYQSRGVRRLPFPLLRRHTAARQSPNVSRVSLYARLTHRSIYWTTAESFGARCHTAINPAITHCITANLGTEKTYRANKMGAKVVWERWFWESVARWTRAPEKEYLALGSSSKSTAVTPAASGPATPAPAVAEAMQSNGHPGSSMEVSDTELPSAAAQDDEVAEQDTDDISVMDDGFLQGAGWDDAAQAELDAFLEDSSEVGEDADGARSTMEG